MVELAWLWQGYQPGAAQVAWFRERTGSDRGSAAVVRRGASAPSSQSGVVPSELSSPERGTVAGIIIPPDVSFAGRACRMRAHLESPLRAIGGGIIM